MPALHRLQNARAESLHLLELSKAFSFDFGFKPHFAKPRISRKMLYSHPPKRLGASGKIRRVDTVEMAVRESGDFRFIEEERIDFQVGVAVVAPVILCRGGRMAQQGQNHAANTVRMRVSSTSSSDIPRTSPLRNPSDLRVSAEAISAMAIPSSKSPANAHERAPPPRAP